MGKLVKPNMLKEPRQPKQSADDIAWEKYLTKLKSVKETNAKRMATYETRLKKRENIKAEAKDIKEGRKTKKRS